VGIWAVRENTHVLLKFFYFGLIDSDLSLLRLSVLNYFFKVFVQNFILVSLRLDIALQLLVIFPHLNVHFVLHDLCLFHENVHHNIDFFSNLISFFLEQLEHIITCDQFILKLFNLFINRNRDIVNATAKYLRARHLTLTHL